MWPSMLGKTPSPEAGPGFVIVCRGASRGRSSCGDARHRTVTGHRLRTYPHPSHCHSRDHSALGCRQE